MKKNILVLTGSPRKHGNSELLAEAFMAGAAEAGHEATKIRAAEKKINDCRACNACFSKGQACIFDDDFNTLAPLLERANSIVLATPLYWFSFPASIKLVLDKMYALLVGQKPMGGKDCLLMATAGEPDLKCFHGLAKSYDLILSFMNWRDKGQLLVPGMNTAGEIKKTVYLEKARQLGLDA